MKKKKRLSNVRSRDKDVPEFFGNFVSCLEGRLVESRKKNEVRWRRRNNGDEG